VAAPNLSLRPRGGGNGGSPSSGLGRGRLERAEPVAALYEQAKIRHVGQHPELEDQMPSYTGAPGERSPV
jgi:phage terminase large subunit-like protein